MSEFSINVQIDEVIQALERAPRNIAKGAFAAGMAAACVPVVEQLESTSAEFGDLSRHIETDIEVGANGEGARGRIGFGKKGFQARMIELGHREVGHKPDLKAEGVYAPSPFMATAAIAASDASVEAFAKAVDQNLNGDILKRAS